MVNLFVLSILHRLLFHVKQKFVCCVTLCNQVLLGVFCLGVLSQRLNRKLVFDRDTKQITNDPEANRMLCGLPPRKGWEQYYNI